MAYTAANLSLLAHGNGFNTWRYDTTDAVTTVDDEGYINNSDDAQKIGLGDLMYVVVWTTAVRTGAVSDVSLHIVMGVAANGDVDLSDDLLSVTPVSGD